MALIFVETAHLNAAATKGIDNVHNRYYRQLEQWFVITGMFTNALQTKHHATASDCC